MNITVYFEPDGSLLPFLPEISLNRIGEYPKPLGKDLIDILDFYTSLPFKEVK